MKVGSSSLGSCRAREGGRAGGKGATKHSRRTHLGSKTAPAWALPRARWLCLPVWLCGVGCGCELWVCAFGRKVKEDQGASSSPGNDEGRGPGWTQGQ